MKSETRLEGPWEFGEKPIGSGGDRKTLDKDLAVMSQQEVKELVRDGVINFSQSRAYIHFKQNFPDE